MQKEYNRIFETILPRVETPGQYVGSEYNCIRKDPATVNAHVALSFPDAYSVGMSYYGLRILYDCLNRQPDCLAERVFAPRPDMERELRAAALPLATLESQTPLSQCDAIGFSLAYELTVTNVLTILDLGGIPVQRKDRGQGMPFVLAGGHATFNPEPLSDFIDAFLIGEAEEAFPEAIRILSEEGGRHCTNRPKVLQRLADESSGWYIPSLYATRKNDEGFLIPYPLDSERPAVRRRVVEDFENAPFPHRPIVPVIETVHERVTLEVMRGCPNGCRFCQAGFVTRPQRERSVDSLVQAAKECCQNTGYDEIGLLSLSTSNYSRFDELIEKMDAVFAPLGISLSLPSLRVDHALSGIPSRFKSVRKSGFTIAPEAGTDRLRMAINKDVTNVNLLAAAEEAYAQGWNAIKLYFMIGLPTETEEDIRAIPELAGQVAHLRRKGPKHKEPVSLSVASFVPKAHTPFQWEAMDTPALLREKQTILGRLVDRKRIKCKTHDTETSFLEGVLARGDRAVGAAILRAWQLGARFDGWSEHFRADVWEKSFAECNIDPMVYACHERNEASPLPWQQIDLGVRKTFLQKERARSREGIRTAACSPEHCAGCGMNPCGFVPTTK